MLKMSVSVKHTRSLSAHLDVFTYISLDVERAAFLDPHYFEPVAARKRVVADFLERAGKRDLFDPAERKAPLSDVLDTVRDFDAPEILAAAERVRLEPLQRGRESDVRH